MQPLLDKLTGWWWPRTIPLLFGSGQIARNLAQFKSIGCATRMGGDCPHALELYGCAGCTREESRSVVLRRM